MTITDITTSIKTPEKPTFPLVAKAICMGPRTGALVLFITECEGCQLTSHLNGPHWSEGWVSCWDADVWTILPPGTEVTLKVS